MKNLLIILLAGILTFSLTTACGDKEDAKTDGDKTEKTEDVEKGEASSGDEVDQWLDEYEAFLNEAIELSAKAKEGDTEAAEKLLEIGQDALKWSEKAQEMGAKMSTEQQERMMKLAQKATEMM